MSPTAYQRIPRNEEAAPRAAKLHLQERPQPQHAALSPTHLLKTVALSLGFMLVSTSLIVANKHIVKDLGFGYPMVVGSMGMLASSIAAFIMCKVLHFTDSSVHVSAGFYCRRMIPVGVAMAITVWTGNLVYLYLTVSFTQMLKAAGPVFIMVAMFLAKLETPTAQLMGSVLTICAGLIIAGSGEVNMSIVGVLVMLISEVGEAVRLVLTQILLQDLQLGPLDGLLYLAPACFGGLFAGALLHEIPEILASEHWRIPLKYVQLFVSAASCGFVTNLLAYALIKVTGSLTLKVLCVVRNVMVIAVGVMLYGDKLGVLQAVGYTISLAAFVYYSHLKSRKQPPSNK